MKNAWLGALTLSASVLAVTTVTERAEAICCGSCCLIDGNCRSAGTVNPADSCQHCDPTLSATAWSPISGCNPSGAGGSGAGGTGSGGTGHAGSGDGSSDDEGCSCRLPGAAPPRVGAYGLAAAGLALAWARRRRR